MSTPRNPQWNTPLHIYIVFICSHRVILQYVNPQNPIMKYPSTHCVYMFPQSDLTVCVINLIVLTEWPYSMSALRTPQWNTPLHIVFICSHRVTLPYVSPQNPIVKYPATHCVYMFSQSDLTVCQPSEPHNEITHYTLCLYVLTEWPYRMSTPRTP